MKTKLFATIFLLLAAAKGNADEDSKLVTIVGDVWMPLAGKAGTDSEGYFVDISRKALEYDGYTVLYSNSVWTRAFNQVLTGQSDCLAGMSKSADRDFLFTAKPFAYDAAHVFGKRSFDWTYNGPQSLKGLKVAIIADHEFANPSFDAFVHNPDNDDVFLPIRSIEPSDTLIKLIERNRVDVYVNNALSHYWEVAQAGVDTLESKGLVEQLTGLYMGCTMENKDRSDAIVKSLDAGLVRMEQTGELSALRSKYGMPVASQPDGENNPAK